MSKKVQKRVKGVARELEESVANAVEHTSVTTSGDDNLFTLDRTGSKAAKRKVTQELIPKQEKRFVSETEKKLIQKVANGVKAPYKKYTAPVGSNNVRDLWAEPAAGDSPALEPKSKRLKTALPGQSYNPSAADHQNTVAEAVALQLKRDDLASKSSAKVLARKLAAESMDYEEVAAIPLSDELGGSLRTVLPKGVPLNQRAAAMRKAGDIAAVDRRTRRAHEKPHAARRIAWHAKYKYN